MRHPPLPLLLLAAGIALPGADTAPPIDRQALVTRHNITWNEPGGRLALGNGEFCIGVDGTGLQTITGNCMAHWAWHSFPLPAGITPDQVPATGTVAQGRVTGPDNFPPERKALRTWLFDNPHILNLGRLRLVHADGSALAPGDCHDLSRTMDLWTGTQTSRYSLAGQPVEVVTCVHPTLDQVAVRITSPLVATGELQVSLDFAYPTLANGPWVGDFNRREGHTTVATPHDAHRVDFIRTVDATTYHVRLAVAEGTIQDPPALPAHPPALVILQARYGAGERWADVRDRLSAAIKDRRLDQAVGFQAMGGDPAPGQAKRLEITCTIDGLERHCTIPDNRTLHLPEEAAHGWNASARGSQVLALTCAFSPLAMPAALPDAAATMLACARERIAMWRTGGAIDLSASRDPRWQELERRIVLSQHLMAVMSAGSWPSSENGLYGIDGWRGQFHMEMVWWHLAHYALWDRWDMGAQAIACYQRFIPQAQALARQLGYQGLKWGKSVGPEGRTAPWAGNQALLWKQPHPIFFAELDYRLHPTRATLERWAAIVEGTAINMADYATKDPATGTYSLAVVMPPCEQGLTRDDVFDLAYWRWGLDKAQEWRQRLGLPREAHWDEVREHLTPLPVVDGCFVHSPAWTNTYLKRAWEHPDPIGVFGMMPPTPGVDAAIAASTVRKVWSTWDWSRVWGWDFPWMAMAAARTAQPRIAVDALLKDTPRNAYPIDGLCNGWYLPGNGGLLYAVAMMAAGWDGAPPHNAPGFPDDGSWTVRWEGLKPAP